MCFKLKKNKVLQSVLILISTKILLMDFVLNDFEIFTADLTITALFEFETVFKTL